jgi:hypothetical protein
MKVIIGSLLLLIIVGCGDIVDCKANPEECYDVSVTGETDIRVELNPRLPRDENGYYHLELDESSWQTLHRLSGTAYLYDEPLEVLKVHWQSSHYWYLGDTLGYIVNRYLTDEGIYVSVDTSYVIGFDGMEVPTVNFSSYSNASGEVNTMFAPVQSMEGDTVTIRMYFWSEWDFIYEEEVFFIVLD